MKVRYETGIIATFLWVGFVGAISFMEAWLKFRAPGINTTLGLGIGKLVFHALNRMEWIFLGAIMLQFLFTYKKQSGCGWYLLVLPAVMLILQTFWLLPVLDHRADMLIRGEIPPESRLHFVYVALEVVKVFFLFLFGIHLLKKQNICKSNNH